MSAILLLPDIVLVVGRQLAMAQRSAPDVAARRRRRDLFSTAKDAKDAKIAKVAVRALSLRLAMPLGDLGVLGGSISGFGFERPPAGV
jgi:hypothetical protein